VDEDGTQVVNVRHKHILYVAERSHREGTGAIGVHCPSV
jgi:hypothetical protein